MEQQTAKLSLSLKALTGKLQIPVLVISNLKRSVRKANKLSHIEDLPAFWVLADDVDLIIFVHREEVYNTDSVEKGTAEIIVSKQKSGPTGSLRMAFDSRHLTFRDFYG